MLNIIKANMYTKIIGSQDWQIANIPNKGKCLQITIPFSQHKTEKPIVLLSDSVKKIWIKTYEIHYQLTYDTSENNDVVISVGLVTSGMNETWSKTTIQNFEQYTWDDIKEHISEIKCVIL